MKATLEYVKKAAERTKSEKLVGTVLEPVPLAQSQEGPTCGFYAMSIVMDYWKAKGRTKMSAPARKRDITTQQRDPAEANNPSLRNWGKTKGALDVSGMAKASTGGVWTPQQLAAVAQAVQFEKFNVSVVTKVDPSAFIEEICLGIDQEIPPIVAFDVRDGEPVTDAAGQHSHWGVVIGYFFLKGAPWFFMTHGHGGYYAWPAATLQASNFALAGTTVRKQLEHKVTGTGTGRTGYYERYTRTQWVQTSKLQAFTAKVAEKQVDVQLVPTGATRNAFEVVQDLAHHIVLVEPAA